MYEREALKKPPPLFPKKLTNFVIVFSETKPYQTQVDRDKPMNLEFGLCYIYFRLQGYQLDHSLSQRRLKHFFDNVLLGHFRLIHVLPLAVHLFLAAKKQL